MDDNAKKVLFCIQIGMDKNIASEIRTPLTQAAFNKRVFKEFPQSSLANQATNNNGKTEQKIKIFSPQLAVIYIRLE